MNFDQAQEKFKKSTAISNKLAHNEYANFHDAVFAYRHACWLESSVFDGTEPEIEALKDSLTFWNKEIEDSNKALYLYEQELKNFNVNLAKRLRDEGLETFAVCVEEGSYESLAF